ncbi:MAG: adenylate/guanylate cyclase domain-containing protein [Aeromicrobium sp.]|uniref:adenylate/guanylate cyclase domain-containing protein n=1 Tax=Aeromicrobium sp. TaxID=1871063 RepID=UPI0039E2E468
MTSRPSSPAPPPDSEPESDRAELRSLLLTLLLREDLAYDIAQAATAAGIEADLARRLWRALGFPEPAGRQTFGDADVETFSLVGSAVDADLLTEETALRLVRALGVTMARLADWEVATLVDQMERDVAAGRAQSRLDVALRLADRVAPGFEQLLLQAWRRHLAAAAARMEAIGAHDTELRTTTMTVGFADLSRFTSLSNQLDDAALGSLVERFEERGADVITAGGGRAIKTLGDAVLYVTDDPVKATRIALDLVSEVGARDEVPAIRVGLATGSVVSRLGDVFGPPVNLAARLSHVARSNRVLVDDTTAQALGPEFSTRALPPRPLRGFGTVSPITVTERRGFRAR